MSLLRDYLSYACNNEAPEMFHVWSAYTCISAAVSRKVWLPFGDQAIYANIYTMLVGDAGNGKSVALQKSKRVLAELRDIPISRSIETPEGLCRFMNGDPKANPPLESPVRFVTRWPNGQLMDCHPMTIIANEFINFISKNPEGWTAMLNDIYDEDFYEYRTKNQGEDNLTGPYIVLLGALTTEVSSDLQKARIISTGLARRTIFQYGERKWHNPHAIPSYGDEDKAKRSAVVDHCRALRKTHGEFKWDEGTRAWWTEWYNKHSSEVPRKAPQVKSWYASKPTQVLKLGMLTSLSEDPTGLNLEIPHLECALAYLAEMEKDLFKIFGGVGRNELAGVALKIFEFISNNPDPLLLKQVKLSVWNLLDSRDPNRSFEECIRYLTDSGQLSIYTATMPGGAVHQLIATPETMKRYVATHSPQHGATPPGSPPGSPPEAGPSTAQP